METHGVLIVDDHAMFRQGLRRLLSDVLEFEVVGEAVDGIEALKKARELRPSVVLMDLRMPVCDGVAATRLLKAELPEAKVVVLTMSDEEQDVLTAIQAGADGYVVKTTEVAALVKSIRGVLAGEAALTRQMMARLIARMRHEREQGQRTEGPGVSTLSEREREVIRLVARGASNREIAAALVVSESTVRSHLHNILFKLGLENRVQAAMYALREGLGP
ncbi:MAG: response regulator transcription factor [Dehalococcoidales bacterium]|nr:response regulator transcription factor [Dehalococcoidales bacterium]